MFKVILVIFTLLVCCYCIENNELLLENARASKKKKNRSRLWSIILLLVFSKVVIFKVASVVLFVVLFQKFCYLIGVLLNYFLKNKDMSPPPPLPEKPQPQNTYGTPEYDTLGYSYGSPNQEAFRMQDPTLSFPNLSDLSGTFSWLFKHKDMR